MYKSKLIQFLYLIIIIYCSCTALKAHEFWIEPESFLVSSNENIVGNLLVGQMMKGVSYGYYPRNFRRFDVKTNNTISPVLGRLGDKPAIKIPAQGNHLVTLIYQTIDHTVLYNDWLQFEKFLEEKNLINAKVEHLKNNLPKTQFREKYSRFAKSLIGSGNSVGNDEKVGLEIEIVLIENPYQAENTDKLNLLLLYQGQPRANTQIEIFSRQANMKVERNTAFTNAQGEATLKVRPATDYMINSVIMRRPKNVNSNPENNAKPLLWESLWASISFAVP